MTGSNRILYCHCAHAKVLPGPVKELVLSRLCDSEQDFQAVPDLCELAARKDPFLKALVDQGPLKIAACYPRAVNGLLSAAGVTLDPSKTELVNLRIQAGEEAAAALLRADLEANLPTAKAGKPVERSNLTPSTPGTQPEEPNKTNMQPLRIVLQKPANGFAFTEAEQLKLVLELLQNGFPVACVASKAQAQPGVGEAVLVLGAADPGKQTQAGPVLRGQDLYFQNITGMKVEAILALAEDWRVQLMGSRPGQWLPWFPVIDYDRCTHCLQCLSFCLFGVFGVDAQQRLEVSLAENCKANCPACSRVCPEAAIIFPKYKTGPINGEEISEPELQREKMKIDVSALLGGDLYEVLRERSQRAQSRFSKERDPDKALQERQKCLARLAQAADIPPEVLMALPSADEIERRAREAAAKAQKILGNNDRAERT